MSRFEPLREHGRRLLGRAGRLVVPERPSGAKALALASVKVVAVVAVLSVGLLVAVTAAVAFYGQYGFHPEENARVWAARELSYSSGSGCQACHAAQWNTHIASGHAPVACESCHGPLLSHDVDPQVTPVLATPESDLCVRCHEATAGRPETFPQVDLAVHYKSGVCLGCHDPHSTAARRPPVVSHPLDFLPACTVCHNPAGLKELPAGHEEAEDAVCLGCHAAGASGLEGASR